MTEKAQLWIDLNADLGEGMDDAPILACLSSANIACGGHTGDPASMRRALRLAKAAGVRVGAHPSFPDPATFGRANIPGPWPGLFEELCDQVQSLLRLAEEQGLRLHHLKPHGALYNQAAQDPELGRILLAVIQHCDPRLHLLALAGSPLVQLARAAGVSVVEEAFADRGYQDDGQLVPRTQAGACLEQTAAVVAQSLQLVRNGQVRSISDRWVPIRAQTLCVHGDGERALQLVRAIRAAFEEQQIHVGYPSQPFESKSGAIAEQGV